MANVSQDDADSLFDTLCVGGKELPFNSEVLLTLKKEKIGESCNEVYKVKAGDVVHGLDGEIAMKVIADKHPKNDKIIDNKQEIRILKEARGCDEIVQFFGATFVSGYFYVFMELMVMDLNNFMAGVERHPPKENSHDRYIKDEDLLAHVAVSMTEGLLFLKTKMSSKTVHSDIKPGNVLISQTGQVKIADLGIAKIIPPERPDQSHVTTNHMITIQYSAPERLSQRHYRGRSDVWSMGLTLHHVATSHYYYTTIQDNDKNKVLADLSAKIIKEDAPVLSKKETGYTLPMCTFINTCLVKDVNQRNDIVAMSAMKIIKVQGTKEQRSIGQEKMAQAVQDIVNRKIEDQNISLSVSTACCSNKTWSHFQ